MTILTDEKGSFRNVLRVALPLIMAASGHAIKLFSDRVMLSWVSSESLAASMPSGNAAFTALCFFMGMAGYVNTFVAQYMGAKHPERIGVAIWQGIYLSLIGGVLVASTAWFAKPMVALFGHDGSLRQLEIGYFSILVSFGWANLLTAAVNSFWSGRGQTRVVMIVELSSAVLNVLFN